MRKFHGLTKVKGLLNQLRINRYSVAIFGVAIWLVFFDSYNFSTQRQLSNTVDKLKTEKIQLKQDIEVTRQTLSTIENDKEKYARERYFMHAPNEDVFLINKK